MLASAAGVPMPPKPPGPPPALQSAVSCCCCRRLLASRPRLSSSPPPRSDPTHAAGPLDAKSGIDISDDDIEMYSSVHAAPSTHPSASRSDPVQRAGM